jgi:hypothetical protein
VPADREADALQDGVHLQKKAMMAAQRLRDDVAAERAAFAEW